MTVNARTIVNLHQGTTPVSGENANEFSVPASGVLSADLQDINSALTGVSLSALSALVAVPGSSTALGGSVTDQEINSEGWQKDGVANGSIFYTLTFPAGQGAMDIEVFNNVTGSVDVSQNTMRCRAIGATTGDSTFNTDIGSNSTTGRPFTFTGIAPDVNDQILIVLQNDGGGQFITLNGFTLTPVAGASPAVISSPAIDAATDNLLIVSAASNDPGTGTLYAVAVASGAAAPSAAQVVLGQDSAGAAALGAVSIAYGTSPQAVAITGLTASTNFDVYFIHDNGNGLSNLITVPGSTTAATTQTTFELVNDSNVAFANTLFDFMILDAFGGTVLETGQFSADASGTGLITGLTNVPAGPAYIVIRANVVTTFISAFNITVT